MRCVLAIGLLLGSGCGRVHFEPSRTDAGATPDAASSRDGGPASDGSAASCPPIPCTTSAPVDFAHAGANQACAISAGRAYCWGDEAQHIGVCGEPGDVLAPLPLAPPTDWTRIYVTELGGCGAALSSVPDVICFGSHYSDPGPPRRIDSPVALSGVSIRRFHACAIDPDGGLWCWGDNSNGQVGTGTAGDWVPFPTRVGTDTWTTVATGGSHTCAISTAARTYCWGDNERFAITTADSTDRHSPTELDLGDVVLVSLSGGKHHTCGLTATGDAYCWGWNFEGEMGVGDRSETGAPPRLVMGAIAEISAGWFHTCAVTTGAQLFCWGNNLELELGVGVDFGVFSLTPIEVDPTRQWRHIAAGGLFTCAITTAQELYCWGRNDNGEAGVGDRSPRDRPARVCIPGA